MNGDEQCDRHAEAQDPPTRREERHVHVIQHEHLIAQHREAIEIVAALLVRDGGNRCQQRRDVRLERDGHLVAEAALHAGADDLEEPGRGGRNAERKHGESNPAPVTLQRALAEQLEPEREQCIRQRRQQRQ